MNDKPLLTIYGARVTKANNGVNITLIEGDGEARTYRNAVVKFEGGKTTAKIEGEYALIKIKLFADAPKKADSENEHVEADDLPF